MKRLLKKIAVFFLGGGAVMESLTPVVYPPGYIACNKYYAHVACGVVPGNIWMLDAGKYSKVHRF